VLWAALDGSGDWRIILGPSADKNEKAPAIPDDGAGAAGPEAPRGRGSGGLASDGGPQPRELFGASRALRGVQGPSAPLRRARTRRGAQGP
jgi:hypothetical protein